jgi:hypothetical protein
MATCALYGCSRPVHVDPRTGIAHDYCGRTHAAAALGARNMVLAPPHGDCHQCQFPGCTRTVYFDQATGCVHDFCSQKHARDALEQGLGRRQAASSSRYTQCAMPGCAAPCFVDAATGLEYDFCGRTHARLASSRGLVPPPAGMLRSWVSKVWSGRPGEEPYTLSLLTNQFPKYQGLKDQFVRSWDHDLGPDQRLPTVLRIYQVRNSSAVYETYCDYKAQLEAARGDANEKRLFHGTSLDPSCSFGISQTQPPCSSPHCAVCNICEASFDLSRAGGGGSLAWGGVQRYTPGLYFSRTSSKSNDYAAGSNRDGVRAMFLCRVLVGNSLRTPESELDEADLELAFGTGSYDSVEGLSTSQGGLLNHPETVVFRAEAAIPSYLVVYQLRPQTTPGHLAKKKKVAAPPLSP